MQYRREIDGLRAVAVLPVILFHAGFSVFSGGFVGVDVFFVISGYLITSILIAELEQGKFSIARFYERRARRILPALFLVMLSCVPFAYMWMLPSQLTDFSESIVSVVFFASNILFWRESGYFAPAAELKPLLHTWSLAVEEQYYLLFPLLLLLLWRLGRRSLFWIIVISALLSLLLAEWGWRNAPTANFYLAPTRFWELLAGSICAFLTVGREQRSSNAMSILGLALIVFSIFGYDESVPFPSIYTLVPVFGTVLVILFAAKGTWVARLLSWRGFVGIGLISYSAYLWHQPLFAFARLHSLSEPSHALMAFLALAALLLAWATWRYVEQPFRKRANPILVTQRSVFVASGVFGATAVVVCAVVIKYDGVIARTELRSEIQRDLFERDLASECFDLDLSAISSVQDVFCEQGALHDFNKTVVVLGDSHALSFYGVLAGYAEEAGIRLLLSGISGCVPLVDIIVQRNDRTGDYCALRNTAAFSDQALMGVDAVVLIARWTTYGFGDVTGELRRIGLSRDLVANEEDSYRVFGEQYAATLQRIASLNIPIIVVHQAPLQDLDAVRIFQHAAITGYGEEGLSEAVSIDLSVHNARYGGLQADLQSAAAEVGGARVEFVDVASVLCDPICQIVRGGRSVYYDDDHLSNFGAQILLPSISSTLERLIER